MAIYLENISKFSSFQDFSITNKNQEKKVAEKKEKKFLCFRWNVKIMAAVNDITDSLEFQYLSDFERLVRKILPSIFFTSHVNKKRIWQFLKENNVVDENEFIPSKEIRQTLGLRIAELIHRNLQKKDENEVKNEPIDTPPNQENKVEEQKVPAQTAGNNAKIVAPAPEDIQAKQTAFFEMVKNNKIQEIEELLQTEFNVNFTDAKGNTPLHYAVENGSLNIVTLLLNKNASVNVRNGKGRTPLYFAAQYDKPFVDTHHCAILQLLLEKGADAYIADNNGNLPHNICFRRPPLQILYAIPNRDGDLPIHTAVKNPPPSTILEKIAYNTPDINKLNRDGKTALKIAAERNNYQLVKEVLKYGDPNIPDRNNSLPLHEAAKHGNVHLVQLLLHKTNDLTVRDNAGKTALDLARENGHESVINILLHQML